MSKSVVIADYGIGNLLSVARALESVGGDVDLSADPARVAAADRLVVPGVGAFGRCMQALAEHSLLEPVLTFAATGRPMFGICVGMQMLLEVGEEFGDHEGLGLIPGRVRAIPNCAADGRPHKIPHIGWNALRLPEGRGSWDGTILADTAPGAPVYFVHSFTAEPEDLKYRLADADYNGQLISAAIARDNLSGCQFHPEKSGPIGLAIIRRFLSL